MRKHYLKDGTAFKGGIHKMPTDRYILVKHTLNHQKEFFIMVNYLKRHKLKLGNKEANNGEESFMDVER